MQEQYIMSPPAWREATLMVVLGSTGLVVGLALICWALYLLALALRDSI
jgi:hypothetical protein